MKEGKSTMNSKFFSTIILIAAFCSTSFAAIPDGFEVYFNNAANADPNGLDTALADFIDSADVTVEGAFYAISRTVVVDAFINAANRLGTANVRIITDAGNRNDTGCKRLEAAGITVIDETCDGFSNEDLESHNKFCIVDGLAVWTGSYNITDSGTVYNNNNAVLIECPELAQEYLIEFNEMWGAASGPPGDCNFSTNKTPHTSHDFVCNGVPVSVYFSPTQESSPNTTLDQFMGYLDNARETLHFSIYTFTSYPIASKIIQLYQAGIEMFGVMDNLQADSVYSKYDMLVNAGVPVKLDDENYPHGNLLHHKFAVIDYDTDDAVVLTGSYNWTNSAHQNNDENSLFIHNKAIAELYYNECYRNYYGAEMPTPTPNPSGDPIIAIESNQDVYRGGNFMHIWTTISNPGPQKIVQEFVILDIGSAFGDDRYFFWPSWSNDLDFRTVNLAADAPEQEESILSAVLPHPLPAGGPYRFWAAFLDIHTSTLVGEISYIDIRFE